MFITTFTSKLVMMLVINYTIIVAKETDNHIITISIRIKEAGNETCVSPED